MTNELLDDQVSIEDVEAIHRPQTALRESFPGDFDTTWVYWSSVDTAENGVPDAWVWERLRLRRDGLLAACDFRVVSDAPWDTAPWIDYRQALRDLPASTNNPRQAVWPQPPH